MLLGYNTNGFGFHRFEDAVEIISGLGYQSVALTLERELLDPPDRSGVAACLDRIGPVLQDARLRVTIETGSRFLLNPWQKHHPTLISRDADERQRRVEFLLAAVDIAARLSADSVSLWSGKLEDGISREHAERWLEDGLRRVLDEAGQRSVRVAFEPEPGMLIERMSDFERLSAVLDHPWFGLTLDVGHVLCMRDGEIGTHVSSFADRLWNVHIEDMKCGVHDHLMFGEGDLDFDAVFAALRQVSYPGPLHVELSRHSHDAVAAARQSKAFLDRFAE